MPLHQSRTKSWFGGVLALVGFILFIESFQVYAQKPVVYVVPIEGVIDLGLAPFVQRVLEEAATYVTCVGFPPRLRLNNF